MTTDMRVLLLTVALPASWAGADTITVNPDGTGDHTHVQDAIDAAQNGDVISIVSGTYQDTDGDGVVADLKGLELSVVAPGGNVTFDGDDAARGLYALNVGAYLSGIHFVDCVAPNQSGGGAVYIYGPGESSHVYNCTFTFCSAPGSFDKGGAILHRGDSGNVASLELDGCTFTSNGATAYGGAMFLEHTQGSVFSSLFSENSSTLGGAMEIRGGEVVVWACTFADNIASSQGGAVRVYSDDPTVNISECEFHRNIAVYGSAIDQFSGILGITSCLIDSNIGLSQYGAISLNGFDSGQWCFILDSTISRNTCADPNGVAAISGVNDPTCNIEDSTLCDHPAGWETDVAWIDDGGVATGGWCCAGDVDENGRIDGGDVIDLMNTWSTSGDPDNRADCDRDSIVNVADLLVLLAQWGDCD